MLDWLDLCVSVACDTDAAMPLQATIIRVLIASPGDTASARQAVRETIEWWNTTFMDQGVMLYSLMWENDTVPEMGDRPQGVINRQLVDDADVLIGIFWTRLGTPTEDAESGTVEEIERMHAAGKPVMLYFSNAPVVPESIDLDEYQRLREARDDFRRRGLVDSFDSEGELSRKLTTHLVKTVRDHFAPKLESSPEERHDVPRAALIASIQGRAARHERFVIANTGSASAEQVIVTIEVPEGVTPANPPTIAIGDDPIGVLPPGAAIDFPMARTFGTAPRWDVVFCWTEAGVGHEARQTLA